MSPPLSKTQQRIASSGLHLSVITISRSVPDTTQQRIASYGLRQILRRLGGDDTTQQRIARDGAPCRPGWRGSSDTQLNRELQVLLYDLLYLRLRNKHNSTENCKQLPAPYNRTRSKCYTTQQRIARAGRRGS